MARVTQSLPVRTRPESVLVTLVRDDVVEVSSCSDSALALTLSTQWMLGKEPLASLLPLVAVAALGAALSSLVMLLSDHLGQVLMLSAVPHTPY